jgi:geranylgeranyl diphosphate synthase, type II
VSTSEPLSAFLTRTRVEIDEALERYLPKPPACPAIVSDAMRYSVFAGGKRLRPVLTLAAAEAAASATEHGVRQEPGPATSSSARLGAAARLALPAACAIEMIHTYSLIHDDLPAMDNDTLRRGRPTLHVVHGDGIAILAGDGLHAEAFTLLAREPHDERGDRLAVRKLRVLQIVGEAAGAIGMVGGQAIDLQAAGQTPGPRIELDADGLRAMHARKTGALIRAAAGAGAIMAGANDAVVSAIDRYAVELGLAFQIVDDILDVEGTAADLGKTVGKDAAEAKPTYPAFFGIERSRALAVECIARADAALASVDIAGSHLAAIADWVGNRKN